MNIIKIGFVCAFNDLKSNFYQFLKLKLKYQLPINK